MRPAVWRFGVVGVALVACWTGGATSTSVGNRASPQPRELTGPYRCSIAEQGFAYPEFPCEIRHDGGRTRLVKLEGSQRFEGEIRVTGDGFRFSGTYFCPFGDCTHALHGTFVSDGAGGFRGTFTDAADLVVRLVPGHPPGYGGASYGGRSYGGTGYGGTGYGGRAIGRNRRP